ncbi:metal-dependent hydrolase, partial [Bordetella bronchiseptica]
MSQSDTSAASRPLVQPRLDAGSGFPTLLRKELLRFWKVSFQTIAAPVITALL